MRQKVNQATYLRQEGEQDEEKSFSKYFQSYNIYGSGNPILKMQSVKYHYS